MSYFTYKKHFVMLEKVQHSGAVVATGDIPKRVFYGYTVAQIKSELKALIREGV